MTMHDPRVLTEVKAMLAHASKDQLSRLMRDLREGDAHGA